MKSRLVGLGGVFGFTFSLLAGCAAKAPGTVATVAVVPLRVAAASDLQDALPTIADRFTAETKVPVTLTFGASGQLAEQIKGGAPFDVFLSANRKYVEDLASGGFVRLETVRPYAVGSLVVAVRGESASAIKELADLSGPTIRKVAIANPAFAPYGRAGKQALERSKLWATIEPKVVLAETVRQALQFVESGNADAGLVGRASAKAARLRFIEVDPALYDPIVQALGIVKRTGQADHAEAFAHFVVDDAGQSLLVDFGFSPAADSAAPSSKDRP